MTSLGYRRTTVHGVARWERGDGRVTIYQGKAKPPSYTTYTMPRHDSPNIGLGRRRVSFRKPHTCYTARVDGKPLERGARYWTLKAVKAAADETAERNDRIHTYMREHNVTAGRARYELEREERQRTTI